MPRFAVTIRATVTKTITVDSDNEEIASEDAHGRFTAANNGDAEKYDEETISVVEVSVGESGA